MDRNQTHLTVDSFLLIIGDIMIDGHVTDVETIHSTTQPLVCNYKMKYSDGIKPQGLNKIFLSRGHRKPRDAGNALRVAAAPRRVHIFERNETLEILLFF